MPKKSEVINAPGHQQSDIGVPQLDCDKCEFQVTLHGTLSSPYMVTVTGLCHRISDSVYFRFYLSLQELYRITIG